MSDALDEADLHRVAREAVDALKARGATFNKKRLRFNEIVQVGLFYARCGTIPSQEVARQGVLEAVESCVTDHPGFFVGFPNDHAPHPHYQSGPSVLDMIQPWMTAR